MEISRRSKIFLGIGIVLLIATAIAGVIVLGTKKPAVIADEGIEIEQRPVSYIAPVIDETEEEEEEQDADTNASEQAALLAKYASKDYDALLGGINFYQSALIKVLADADEYSIIYRDTFAGVEIDMFNAKLSLILPYESFGSKLKTAEKLSNSKFPEFTNLYRTTNDYSTNYNYISHVSLTKECNFFESNTQPPCSNNTLAFLSESSSLQDYVLSISCGGTIADCDKAVSRISIDPQYSASDVVESKGSSYTMASKVVARPGSYSIQALTAPSVSYPSSGSTVPAIRYNLYDFDTQVDIILQDARDVIGNPGYTQISSKILFQYYHNLSFYREGADSTSGVMVLQSNIKTAGQCISKSGTPLNAPCADVNGTQLKASVANEDTYLQITCKGTNANCIKSMERIIVQVHKNNPIYY